MELEDLLKIDTPENVAFDYEVAGIGSRFLAAIVDTLIIVVLQAILFLTLFWALADFDLFDNSSNPAWVIAALSLLAFALLWGYYIFFEMIWNGQSPGKRWLGLRVMRVDGTPIAAVESVIRNLVRLIDFLPAYYGVGVVAMFINEQSRRLGDLAAGTLVVYEQEMVTLDSLARESVPSGVPGSPAGVDEVSDLPVERLTNEDIRLAEEYLRRRGELSNSLVLARRILHSLFKRMELPVTNLSEYRAEEMMALIVRSYRQREGR